MKFTKMHGTGNDYVYINCMEEMPRDPSRLAVRLSDRHFGVGSDGLILICPSQRADFKMVMYNADGSPSQMCGNGIRCVGKYVFDRGLTDKNSITVETGGGIKTLDMKVENGAVRLVTVDMGTPELEPEKIPVDAGGADFISRTVIVGGCEYAVTCVSMGNPHAVIFVPDPDAIEIEKLGPAFERHLLFPERVNTEFVQVVGRNLLKMRVWERGSGETLACGTGASAALVAAVLNGKADRQCTLILKGGELEIRWDGDSGHVFMTGPAEFVFDGELFQGE